jgi:hypothetical protein
MPRKFESKTRIMWCRSCGWFVCISDGVGVNNCQRCSKMTPLNSMEFSKAEWEIMERFFKERYGVEESDV